MAQGQPHLQYEGGFGRILNSFEIFMVDLVIYRNEGNPIENEGALVLTTFSPLKPYESYLLPWKPEF